MTATLTPIETEVEPLVIHFSSVLKKMTEDDFAEFVMLNQDLNFELSSTGDLIIIPPTTPRSANRNFKLTGALGRWTEDDGTGLGFDSSSLFSLPNGARRSPDVSWVRKERWEALEEKEKEGFSHICPDFVVELRSVSDRLPRLQRKMEEYIANGALLGWLLDPFERKVHIYRPNRPTEVLDDPASVSGDPVLPGFVLDVRAIWE
jgi:Uma2 family endonuclease